MSAINDLIRWWKTKGVYDQYAKLADELLPIRPDVIDSFPEATLAQAVFCHTGLPPSEFKRLEAAERVVWLARAVEKIRNLPPLSDREKEVDELIRIEGPLTGKQLSARLGIGEKVLSNHVIPALKKRGLQNRRAVGYFYPALDQPPMGKTLE